MNKNEKQRLYYQVHKSDIEYIKRRKINSKKYRQTHKKEIVEYDKIYRQRPEVKERDRIKQHEWIKNNPEKFKKTQQKYVNNDKRKKYLIEYRKIHGNEYYMKNRKTLLVKQRLRYKLNRDVILKRVKSYRKLHPEKRLQSSIKHLTKYGTPFNIGYMEYKSALYIWSKTIKKLDNNMCKLCGSTTMLNAHHIQPKKDYPKLSLDLGNGITLCKKCHNNIHY